VAKCKEIVETNISYSNKILDYGENVTSPTNAKCIEFD